MNLRPSGYEPDDYEYESSRLHHISTCLAMADCNQRWVRFPYGL